MGIRSRKEKNSLVPTKPLRIALTPECKGEGVLEGVTWQGRCAEGFEEENYKKYGYESPREHYIYGPRDVTVYQVARHWQLNEMTVYEWRDRGNWDAIKQEHLKALPATLGGEIETHDVKALQQKVIEDQLQDLEEARQMTLTRMRAKTEEVNTAVGPQELKKTDMSFCRLASTLIDIHAERRVAAGLHTKMTGALSGATIDARQVSMTVIERPKGAYSPRRALSKAREREIVDAMLEAPTQEEE